MSSFGYDDLFNNKNFKESFGHSRTGFKNKFIPGKQGYTVKNSFTDAMDDAIVAASKPTPLPKQPFRSNQERYMTSYDQYNYDADNVADMSDYAIRRNTNPRKTPFVSKTRFQNWSGLNSS